MSAIVRRGGALARLLLVASIAVWGTVAAAAELPAPDAIAASTEVGDRSFADRRASLKRMGDPRFIKRPNARVKSYDVLAATALKGCGPAEWPAYMAGLPTMADGSDEPIEMFSLPPLVRYLYQFGHCMSAAQKQTLLAGLSKPQNLLGHGTLNHAILRASSWYLLAQYFPQAKWTEWNHGKEMTSAQLMAALKPLLMARTRRFYQSGQYEWLSPTYAMPNIFPLLNLIDFANDPAMRRLAEEEAILDVAVLRAHSFHGVIVPPLTRKNFEQRNAMDSPQNYVPSISQQVLWYYYGEPAGLGVYDFRSDTEPFYVTILGLSDWRPPRAVLALNKSTSGDYAIKLVTPRFTNWGDETAPEIFGDAFIADDFSVGTGNLLFDPAGYSGHIQTFSIMLKSDQAQNQIECYQPYWNSAKGEDGWDTDRSSPFQQMYRYDDSSVVMLFDIPKGDPWVLPENNRFWPQRSKHKDALLQLATCRIPRNFDEIISEPNWVFVRNGSVFVAMATLNGKNEYDNAVVELTKKYRMVKVREAKTALFFRVDRARPDLNFAQFREAVRRSVPVYDNAASSVLLTEKSGIKTQVQFRLQRQLDGRHWSALPLVLRNGQPVVYGVTQVIASPLLNLKNGTLRVTTAGQELQISR